MVLIVEQMCFLHLPLYKNCRKTLTQKNCIVHGYYSYHLCVFGICSLLCRYQEGLLRKPASTGSTSVNTWDTVQMHQLDL